MLKRTSVLKHSAIQSVIKATSALKPEGGHGHREINQDLLLTALIDAFSILVIFLLMSFSSSGELIYLGKDTELPKAAKGDTLERNPVVKLESGKIFLEDKEVSGDQLVEALLNLRKQFQETRPGEEFPGIVTVQADRRVKYESLNSIVQASAHAGYSDIKFAVLMQ